MTRDAMRVFCLRLPHVTEIFQMHHACFQVGGKTFLWLNLETEGYPVTIKCSPEEYTEMVERNGVIPAPYLARAHWVSLTDWDMLPAAELKALLSRAREVVLSKLSKKMQAELAR